MCFVRLPRGSTHTIRLGQVGSTVGFSPRHSSRRPSDWRLARRRAWRIAARIHRARAWTCREDYFTRWKTRCDAIEPIMPSTVMVWPSALRVVLDVPVPPGPATEPS